MNLSIPRLLVLVAVLMPAAAWADDRPDHFEGAASETLEEAMENVDRSNRQLAEILAQDEITMADVARIHELTYTLENAFERIDDEYQALEEQLEALHLASEGAETKRVRELGGTYLENAERFEP